MTGDYTGQLRNPNMGRWVETELIFKFPYTQKEDWITQDMIATDLLIDMNCIFTDLSGGFEVETFDSGFTLRCDKELYAPIRMCIAFGIDTFL